MYCCFRNILLHIFLLSKFKISMERFLKLCLNSCVQTFSLLINIGNFVSENHYRRMWLSVYLSMVFKSYLLFLNFDFNETFIMNNIDCISYSPSKRKIKIELWRESFEARHLKHNISFTTIENLIRHSLHFLKENQNICLLSKNKNKRGWKLISKLKLLFHCPLGIKIVYNSI